MRRHFRAGATLSAHDPARCRPLPAPSRPWAGRGWPALRLALFAVPALALFLGSSEVLAQGCAMCGTVISSSKDPLARGMFLSIMFMLAVPNVLLASVGGWLIYTYRKAARGPAAIRSTAREAAAGPSPFAIAGSSPGLSPCAGTGGLAGPSGGPASNRGTDPLVGERT